MSDTCKTVRIKSSHPESQGEFVEINESDFDPAIHELLEPAAEPKGRRKASEVQESPAVEAPAAE